MKKFKEILANPLFAGSFVMIFGSNAVSFLNYLYQTIIVRLLPPAEYGELLSLLSLSALIGIIPLSFGLVIIKFVSSAKKKAEISSIVSWFNSKTLLFSIILFLIIFTFSSFISSFLNIRNNFLVILIAATFIFSLTSFVYKSVLQGILKFQPMIITLFVETSLKLVLGVLLIYLGFGVFGAISGFVIASISGFFLSRFYIRNFINKVQKELNVLPIFLYSLPVFIQSISNTSLYSSDLILVKHFFQPHEAGIYALISTLGKIVFFGTGPIGAVMFPIISKRQAKGENYQKIFQLSFLLTLILAAFVLIIYWFAPQLVIKMLNPSYLEASPLLVWYGIFMTLFTLSSLYISFFLSLGKTSVVILPLLASIIQIFLIWLFHQSLSQVILINCIVTGVLLLLLLIYSSYENRLNINHRSSL